MREIVMMILMGIMAGISFSAVNEDFEDGDYTNNPTWTVENNYGEASIVEDPIRLNNNVLRIHGTNTAHRVYKTNLATPISWLGFDFSMDYLSSDDNFHPGWSLGGQGGYLSGGLYREPGYPFVLITIADSSGNQYDHTELYNQPSPINDWWRLHIWHDADTGLINFDIRAINTNDLIYTTSFTPSADLFSIPDITTMGIHVEETSWQYVDNVTLVPEPCTLALFTIGGLMLRKRKIEVER